MSAHEKLMDARIKLQGMELRKSGENKFAGYKYFELGDFLPYVQQIFHDLGLCSVVSFTQDMATLSITDLEDGTVVIVTSPMAEAQLKGAHPIQNLGAVESYQRRYLWMAAMEIVEHDIIDATAGAEPPPKPAPKQERPTPKPTGKAPAKVEGKEGPWQIVVEAKADARLGRVEERMDQAIAEMRHLKLTIITTGIAVVLGLGAANVSMVQSMLASFESGKSSGAAITQATEQLKQTQQQIQSLQDALVQRAKSR